ncbi:MAG: MoxR family ATPase [Acidobacteria bacterium]|nr:MoxR family ATPase [Acidobacteriota bacterium]
MVLVEPVAVNRHRAIRATFAIARPARGGPRTRGARRSRRTTGHDAGLTRRRSPRPGRRGRCRIVRIVPNDRSTSHAGLGDLLDEFSDVARRIESELARRIIGQRETVREILMAFMAGGHCLLRGVPGLAKTLLIKSLAETVAVKFNRIQFTPDLMPSDILGAEVIEEDRASGRRTIRFIHGPIFANILLADEINRTPPKTQAALLEAMQEAQVTVNGVRYALDRPLFVLATQNPIEQEGTYPLPEAQLDRFMFNVVIDYPTAEEERAILSWTTGTASADISAVATGAEIERLHRVVREVPAAANVVDYATRLVRATRPSGGDDEVPAFVRRWVRWGAGPRAGQSLLLGGKARALLDGRAAVDIDDVRAVAAPVLRHRVLVNFEAEADGITAEAVVEQVLGAVRAGRG